MKITSVKVIRFEQSETKLKGAAVVVLDNMFAVTGIKILFNNDTYFLAMPSRKTKDGTFRDMAHPINEATRSLFESAIFYAFKKAEETNSTDVLIKMDRTPSDDDYSFNPDEYEIEYNTREKHTADTDSQEETAE